MSTWDGENNSDFLTGVNWDGDVAPAPGSAVVIDGGGGANQPILGAGDASIVDTVSVSGGSLTVDGNLSATTGVSASGSGSITVGAAGSISGDVSVNSASYFRVDGSLTGNLFSFGGTTILKTSGSGIGTLTLSGGEVNVETFGPTLDIGDLAVNGGTLRLDNAFVSADSLSGSGGNINLTAASGQASLTFGSDGSSTLFSGNISAQVTTELVKEGSGTTSLAGIISGQGTIVALQGRLELSGGNSFAGAVSANNSIVALTGSGSLANAAAVTLYNNAVFDISGTFTGATVNTLSTYGAEFGTLNTNGKTLNIAQQASTLGLLTVNGGNGTDALSITMASALEDFNLDGTTFIGWTNNEDTISIIGNALDNVISGNSDNNVLNGGGGADTISGRDGDIVSGGTGNDKIINSFVNGGTWDGGADTDTLDVSADQFDFETFDLSAASFNIYGATFSNFENVIGTQGHDTIIGNAVANDLNGQDGNDTISGGLGGDHIDGGAGTSDTVDYRSSTGVIVNINLALDTAFGGHAQGDTLDGIENIWGSLTVRDSLVGDGNSNTIYGFGGNDSLRGGGGDDFLEGGAGGDAINGDAGTSDTASYRDSNTGQVSINLLANTYSGGDAQGDTLFFIENLEGSLVRRDILIGNNIINRIYGNGGADSIRGEGGNDFVDGGAGGDSLNGGAGIDTVSYVNSLAGVTINLNVAAQTSGGDAAGDNLLFFENVNGSDDADSLTGSYQSNRLVGNAGGDTLDGGLGSDYLTGGADADTFRFTDTGFGTDRILDWEDGADLISVALPLETSFAGLIIQNNGTTDVTVKGFNGGGAIIVHADFAFTLDAGDFVFV